MTTKAVIFDFFGVICSEFASPWYKTRIPPHLLPMVKERYDRPANLGYISDAYFFNGVGKVLNLTAQEVRREWEEKVVINQELVSLIGELSWEFRIALCSNAHREFLRAILKEHDLQKLFDTIVISSEVGCAKPGREIFGIVLSRLGVEPSEVIFVDDREENIQVAKSLGMEGVLFRNVSDLSGL